MPCLSFSSPFSPTHFDCAFSVCRPQSLRLQGMGGCPAHFEHDPHLEQGGVLSVPSVVTDKVLEGG